jgi:hypothetical protein
VWRAVFRQALVLWAVVRGVALVLTVIAALLAHGDLSPMALLQRWAQWDAGWYLSIAQHGYYSLSSGAFFPLLPALTALLALPLGGHLLIAAMLVTNLSALAVLLGIGLLTATEEGSPTAGTRAMLAMAAYPLAFYLVAPYSESVFLALAIFSFYFARRGQWGWSALFAALAGLTRPTSLVLGPALLWEYGRQRGWWEHLRSRQPLRWRRLLYPRALGSATLAVGALPAAVLAYLLFLAIRFGDPLAYTHAGHATWHITTMPPWQTLWLMAQSALHPPTSMLFRAIMVLDFSAFFAVAAITISWARRIPVIYTVYLAGLLLLVLGAPIPTRPEVITSDARYLLTAFPIHFIASRWMKGRPKLALVLLALGFFFQAIFCVWFLTGHWVE